MKEIEILEPSKPVYQNFRPQDRTIARVTHPSSQRSEKLDIFVGAKNGSEKLERLLDTMSASEAANFFNRH